MENYEKGQVVEKQVEFTIDGKHENIILMQVKPVSKIQSLTNFGLSKMEIETQIAWTASGDTIHKAISCAEILKQNFPELHQVTKIGYNRMEEYWEPKIDGLDRLRIVREVPVIYILLSKTTLPEQLGYQAPGSGPPFLNEQKPKSHKKRTRKKSERMNSEHVQ